MRVLLLALCFVACSAALPPASRALCYAAADLYAQARVDRECRIGDAGVDISECPSRDEILEEFQKSQEACK
jgi:hypothetical protein